MLCRRGWIFPGMTPNPAISASGSRGTERAEKRGTRYIFRYSGLFASIAGCLQTIENIGGAGGESNPRLGVLQTSPLPLGYRAHSDERPCGVCRHCTDSNSALPGKDHRLRRLERETGLEPATLALARRCSTTELLPRKYSVSISGGFERGQRWDASPLKRNTPAVSSAPSNWPEGKGCCRRHERRAP